MTELATKATELRETADAEPQDFAGNIIRILFGELADELDKVDQMAKPKLPDCPTCGSNRAVYEDGDRNLYCNFCKVAFDSDPEEGGDYSTDPTRRMRQQEAIAKREKLRGGRR